MDNLALIWEDLPVKLALGLLAASSGRTE